MKNNFVISIALKFFIFVCILLVLSAVGLIVKSCTDCNCPPTKTFEYSISSFSVNQLERGDLMWIMNNIQQAGGNLIEFREDFGVCIAFEIENTIIANYKPVYSLFIQSAYADCPPGTFYPKNRIISIQVFSDKNFSETYPAGMDIAEFFKIYEGGSRLASFESYVNLAPSFSSPPDIWFRCVLTATAIEANEYKFTFVVGLSDERILEQSIKAILE